MAVATPSRLAALPGDAVREDEKRGGGRVLIVSPHFPPINAPDHHRVRLALPWLAQHGWNAEILTVHPDDIEAPLDETLARTLPPGLTVHSVPAVSPRLTRLLGFSNLAWRAYGNLRRQGDELLASGRFDLVFFSTTQFGVLPLGPWWRRRYGVPYVLDFQDEWIGTYYKEHPQVVPPGGRWKYGFNRLLAYRDEPETVSQAAAVVSVSPRYNEHLHARYPSLPASRFHHLPFGGAESDFDQLNGIEQPIFDPYDGLRHWVYVGRGGSDLHLAADAFFTAVRRALDAGLLRENELRLHFVGTSYAPAPAPRPSFLALAQDHGLSRIVTEHPGRLGYLSALQCLRQADAVLILGSDDPGYHASKIFPAMLARRPLLALFHEESGAPGVLRQARAGTVLTFSTSSLALSRRIYDQWLSNHAFDRPSEMTPEDFQPFSARTMTARLTTIFDHARAGVSA